MGIKLPTRLEEWPPEALDVLIADLDARIAVAEAQKLTGPVVEIQATESSTAG